MHTQHVSSYFKHTSITRYALHTFIPSIIQNNITISQSYNKIYIYSIIIYIIHPFSHSFCHSILDMQGTVRWLRNIENTQFDYSVILAIKYIQNHKYTYISIICSSSSFILRCKVCTTQINRNIDERRPIVVVSSFKMVSIVFKYI